MPHRPALVLTPPVSHRATFNDEDSSVSSASSASSHASPPSQSSSADSRSSSLSGEPPPLGMYSRRTSRLVAEVAVEDGWRSGRTSSSTSISMGSVDGRADESGRGSRSGWYGSGQVPEEGDTTPVDERGRKETAPWSTQRPIPSRPSSPRSSPSRPPLAGPSRLAPYSNPSLSRPASPSGLGDPSAPSWSVFSSPWTSPNPSRPASPFSTTSPTDDLTPRPPKFSFFGLRPTPAEPSYEDQRNASLFRLSPRRNSSRTREPELPTSERTRQMSFSSAARLGTPTEANVSQLPNLHRRRKMSTMSNNTLSPVPSPSLPTHASLPSLRPGKRKADGHWRAESRSRGRQTLCSYLGFAVLLGFVLVAFLSGAFTSTSQSSDSSWRRTAKAVLVSSPPAIGAIKKFVPAAIHTPSSGRNDPVMAQRRRADRIRRTTWLPSPRYVEHASYEAPEKDTLVFYRILGNDLPPRHERGQTLRNLRFMMEHEWEWDSAVNASAAGDDGRATIRRVEKYYVLNRLSSASLTDDIVNLLVGEYGVERERILEIPFKWDDYLAQKWKWDGGVGGEGVGWAIGAPVQSSAGHASGTDGAAHGPVGHTIAELWNRTAAAMMKEGYSDEDIRRRRRKAEAMAKLRALDYTFHEKNLYAINNNGGRNFALSHGRNLPHARWVLPLDGNCFFTPAAMAALVRSLQVEGEGDYAKRYVSIPMHRLLHNNDLLLANNTVLDRSLERFIDFQSLSPAAPEEPQVGFRYDSIHEYQPAMRYGRRSKLEFLWRLGAISKDRALDKRTLPWESSDRAHLTTASYASITSLSPYEGKSSIGFSHGGWVYRLFSGDSRQEASGAEANSLRSWNRIKGIVSFLERLDERVARGLEGCDDFGSTAMAAGTECGFKSDYLWTWDSAQVEDLARSYARRNVRARVKVERFEEYVGGIAKEAKDVASGLVRLDAQRVADHSAILALAGYITGKASYSILAADVISRTFLSRFQGMSMPGHVPRPSYVAEWEDQSQGYAYPLPEPADQPKWLRHVAGQSTTISSTAVDRTVLPFEANTFNPIPLIDAVRLLSPTYAPRRAALSPSAIASLSSIFAHHLHYLLFDPIPLGISRSPRQDDEGILYDSKVAALASILDDARLLARIANRCKLRWPEPMGHPHGPVSSYAQPYHVVEAQKAEWLSSSGVRRQFVKGVAHLRVRPYDRTYAELAEVSNTASGPLEDQVHEAGRLLGL